MNMKDHATAQAILQSTGHPLEPLVAYELTKMYQDKKATAQGKKTSPYLKDFVVSALLAGGENFGIEWYNNYE